MSNLTPIKTISGSLQYGTVKANNYNDLSNKPKINDVELSGNTSFEDLGLDDVYAQKSTTLSGYGITDAYTKTEVDAKESTLNAKITDVADDVGELSDLTTTAKTNLVAAVNELDGNVDALIASVSKSETSMKATRAYAIGDYINVNGRLYKATKAIASGATLSTSTNVAVAVIGDELKANAQSIANAAEQIASNAEEINTVKADFLQSLIYDTASGSVVTFPDGADNMPMRSVAAQIVPVQDLHGYDSPWPAGGGVNKLAPTDSSDRTRTQNGLTCVANDDGTFSFTGATSGGSFDQFFDIPGDYVIADGDYLHAVNAVVNASAMVLLAFTDNTSASLFLSVENQRVPLASYAGKTVKRIRFFAVNGVSDLNGTTIKPMIVASSSVTAWSPYSNICPISGWTEVHPNISGINVWDEEWEVGGINSIGNNTTERDRIRAKNYCSCLPSKSYYVRCALNTDELKMAYYTKDKTFISVSSWLYNGVVTTPANAYYFRVFTSGAYGTTYNHDISINYPSTDHSYHPYTGRSIAINLGQTVYGGKLDVLSGELVVYPYYASYNGETLTGEWISDRDKYVSGTTPTIGAQVVNIGAQGVTVQLEPHEVESLYGVNNLWADSGDTEVEYRADTKLFIERLTAPDSADMIADANIVSGKYFMVGNDLYLATANIANGGAITPGTNCTKVSLATALNAINS